jgi:hypothetical protein
MPVNTQELDDILAKARALATGAHPLDSLTLKELKLAADPSSSQALTNDQKASILSVVVYVFVT